MKGQGKPHTKSMWTHGLAHCLSTILSIPRDRNIQQTSEDRRFKDEWMKRYIEI